MTSAPKPEVIAQDTPGSETGWPAVSVAEAPNCKVLPSSRSEFLGDTVSVLGTGKFTPLLLKRLTTLLTATTRLPVEAPSGAEAMMVWSSMRVAWVSREPLKET